MESVIERMEYLTSAFRYLLGFQDKKQVRGYVLTEDTERQRTLLMVQESEKYWVTKWYDHAEYNITPIEGSTVPWTGP